MMVLFYFSFFAHYSLAETVDHIVAVVNEKVITLTDMRIAETFCLYDEEIDPGAENIHQLLLEMMVDQKLVVLLAGAEAVEKEEVDSFQDKIIEKMGSGELEKKLEEFGLDRDDLREYIRDKIIYQKIIKRRFGQGVIVSLEEIEDFYKGRYVPSQREKEVEPKPMMEILKEIESTIKQEKAMSNVKDWINNLKTQADILIYIKN
jgi:hypothetical protein